MIIVLCPCIEATDFKFKSSSSLATSRDLVVCLIGNLATPEASFTGVANIVQALRNREQQPYAEAHFIEWPAAREISALDDDRCHSNLQANTMSLLGSGSVHLTKR